MGGFSIDSKRVVGSGRIDEHPGSEEGLSVYPGVSRAYKASLAEERFRRPRSGANPKLTRS